ncbi:MAG: hypothetical protein ABIQ16_25115, partial [Polyangiaceae bacterium]
VWEARVVVRERKLTEIVDLSVRFCLVLGGSLYVKLSLWVLLPAYAVCYWVLQSGLADAEIWGCALAVVLSPLLQLPFTVAAGRLMFSGDVSLAEVLRTSARLLFRICIVRLWSLLVSFGGSLFVILFPLAVARGLYLGEVVVLEGAGPSLAYRRSGRLTSGRAVQSFMVWLSLVAASLTFIAVAEILAQTLGAEGLPIDGVSEILGGFSAEAGIAGLFLSLPLVATLRFLSYIDNRTRREGWDIQVRFLELGRVLGATST